MGLTPRMADALQAVTEHVAMHGVMPSRSSLAAKLGCNKTDANRLMLALVERGLLSNVSLGGPLSGFGREGVCVFVPAHVAADLARFCVDNSENVSSVVADAIVLHLDQFGGEQ